MFKVSCSRRVVFAAASVALVGGGIALPAAAMAAPAPQHVLTVTPQDDDDDVFGLTGLLDGDLDVSGVMGGDLMDPGYPHAMGGTKHRGLGGLSSWRGDDTDPQVGLGAWLAPGATGSEGRAASPDHLLSQMGGGGHPGGGPDVPMGTSPGAGGSGGPGLFTGGSTPPGGGTVGGGGIGAMGGHE
ncbi:hypothetical protein [Streptomyces sp. NPDC089799]|uniref:hypothetical protein n=1 Tax=Streptomyces sp. NPDC089799 TaxID=3155066 RepID=UPI0034457090